MKATTTLLLTAALALAACATMKDGSVIVQDWKALPRRSQSAEQQARDRQECLSTVNGAMALGALIDFNAVIFERNKFIRCMEARGYTVVDNRYGQYGK